MSNTPEHILHTLNPYRHSSDIVASSARIEHRQTGRRLGNAEQKIGAYLCRVEGVMDNPLVRERLQNYLIDGLVSQPDDIPERYWEELAVRARDEGRDVDIEQEKEKLIREIQNIQREGLEAWSSYFESTRGQYPTWFVVHALDSVVRYADFDPEKRAYRRRSHGTIAPYPALNPEVLAYTYGAINSVYGDNEGVPVDATTESLVRDGSFNRIYSHFMLETKQALPLPGRPEDVHGEWLYYTDKDIAGIASASEGTGWCIADQAIAARYTNRNGAFYFFHLQDADLGILSKSATASIRMQDGKVAEVSGTKGYPDQAVEDVMLDEVADKVFSLPGGDTYYGSILDKKKLIEMDRKFQDGEHFSIEELRFLYEVDRKIDRINNYPDVRIKEFRAHRDVHERQLAAVYGDDMAMVMVLDERELTSQFIELIEKGVSVDILLNKLDRDVMNFNGHIFHSTFTLFIDGLVPYLLSKGADPNLLIEKISPRSLIENHRILIDAGAVIDIEATMDNIGKHDIIRHASDLLDCGATSEQIINKLTKLEISKYFHVLIERGVDPNLVITYLTPATIVSRLSLFLDAGAEIDLDQLVLKMKPATIASQLPTLIKYGANIDVQHLLQRLPAEVVLRNLVQFQAVGVTVDIAKLLTYVKPTRRKALRGWILAAGHNPDHYRSELRQTRKHR